MLWLVRSSPICLHRVNNDDGHRDAKNDEGHGTDYYPWTEPKNLIQALLDPMEQFGVG
jgi:hypothetical protein